MISICITIKNRSRVFFGDRELQLFPNCVRSIAEAVGNDVECELVISDWHSDDWPLHQWVQSVADRIPVRIVTLDGAFSRGYGRNAAAKAAKGECLFFADADCLLCRDLFDLGLRSLSDGKAFFPVLFSFDTPQHQSGWWRHEGYGNCMLTRELFDQCGGWPDYATWGKEDDHFFARIASLAEVVREEVPGFYHQWHPEDIVWKNRFAERAAEIAHEVEQVNLAQDELSAITPPGAKLILVDETRFGSDPLPMRQTIPFLERNGEYAGPPGDDDTAIAEFERMRASGASFIAFAWMAFWWTDHYSRFAQHLRSSFPCILNNERLVVFDLQTTGGSDVH